jgi:hypothetical protein
MLSEGTLKLEIERQCCDSSHDLFGDVCESLGALNQRYLNNNCYLLEHLQEPDSSITFFFSIQSYFISIYAYT